MTRHTLAMPKESKVVEAWLEEKCGDALFSEECGRRMASEPEVDYCEAIINEWRAIKENGQ